jgi:competence protein ComFC
MKNFAKEFANDLVNLFFPLQCLGCNCPLVPDEKNICVHCQLQLPFTCFHLDENNPMTQKLNALLKIEATTSLCYFEKNSVFEQLIYQLKYGVQEQLGAYFGSLMGELLLALKKFKNVEAIIPVPLHPRRKRKRGYNQVSLFGKTIVQHLNVPFIEGLLLRTENTKQLAKTTDDRNAVLKNAFELGTKNSNPKHWLLVDDVITTGAKLDACDSLLLKNPENQLSIATIGYRI